MQHNPYYSSVLVWSCGQNAFGELGHGDTRSRAVPEVVEALRGKTICQIACGNEHSLFLDAEGEVHACGFNQLGQCAVVSTAASLPDVTPCNLSVEHGAMAAICTGNGAQHSFVVAEDGELVAFGDNQQGQCGLGSKSSFARPLTVSSLSRHCVRMVACNYTHALASTTNGQLFAWGCNSNGQLGTGDYLDRASPALMHQAVLERKHRVVQLACGHRHTMILFNDGWLFGCGDNNGGQLGRCDLLSEDGHATPTAITAPEDSINWFVTQVSCGYHHTVCLTSEGAMYSTGRNESGQLGLPPVLVGTDTEPVRTFQRVAALASVRLQSVACGSYHTVCVDTAGRAWAFGANSKGQLGVGDHDNVTDSSSGQPLEVIALQDHSVIAVTCGFYHTMFLTATKEQDLDDNVVHRAGNTLRAALQPDKPVQSLALDLWAARCALQPEHADVVFVVEGKPIPAHRAIVAARCEALGNMLKSELLEARERDVHIRETSHAAFLAFIEFLYTDTVEVLREDQLLWQAATAVDATPDTETEPVDVTTDATGKGTATLILELLALADRYLLPALKRQCEVALVNYLAVDTVCSLLISADAANASWLGKRAVAFSTEHLGELMALPAFADLPARILRKIFALAAARGVHVSPPLGVDPTMTQFRFV